MQFVSGKMVCIAHDSHRLLLPLNSDSHLPKILFIYFNDSPSKFIKNAFYFILKYIFVLKIVKFIFWPVFVWSCRKKGLIRKIRFILKFMMPQPGYKTIAIQRLHNISQSKGNQTMKFGELIG